MVSVGLLLVFRASTRQGAGGKNDWKERQECFPASVVLLHISLHTHAVFHCTNYFQRCRVV